MRTVYGVAFDAIGAAMRSGVTAQGDLYRRCWGAAAAEVRKYQPARIGIDVRHDNIERGRCVHLERTKHGNLVAVAEIDDEIPELDYLHSLGYHDLFWSPQYSHEDGRDVEITWLTLTPWPASLAAKPIQILQGDLSYRGAEKRWTGLDGFHKELLARAADTRYRRRVNDPLTVYDAHTVDLDQLNRRSTGIHPAELEAMEPGRPPGKLRHSTPLRGSVISVR